MGMKDQFDEMKDKAKDALGGKGDQVDEQIDKVADKADEATGGKATEGIDKASQAAKDKLGQ